MIKNIRNTSTTFRLNARRWSVQVTVLLKIRTYNYPQGRVTDHRINFTLYNLQAVMDGEIDEIIEKLQIEENTERLKESGL